MRPISGIPLFTSLSRAPLCRGGGVWSGGRAAGSGEVVSGSAASGFLTRRFCRIAVSIVAAIRHFSRGWKTAQTQATQISIAILISDCRPSAFLVTRR